MDIFENIRLAWEGLKANRMRALLTMLGIIIGIASVIAILTVGDGLSKTITTQMSDLGATNIRLSLQPKNNDNMQNSMTTTYDDDDLITDDMIAALQAKFPHDIVGFALSENIGSGQAKDGRLYANVAMSGVNQQNLSISGTKTIAGRDFTERDVEGNRMVAIVSDKFVSNMFGGENKDAIGKEISVYVKNSVYDFSIIGIYHYEGMTMGAMMGMSDKDVSTSLYIPITTAKSLTSSKDGYSMITISGSTDANGAKLADDIQTFMNDRFYADNPEVEVMTMSMESIMESLNTIMGTISIALACIAAISLLVGGIGVMNIMLVSVTERTREIGTRKALGATNKNIRLQFVVESMIICLIGGAIGLVLGASLGYFGSNLMGAAAFPSVFAISLSLGFSMFVGLFFGYYPANKAALLDPIEALRYE